MSWSGYPNGQIPLSLLVEFEGTGKYLQADAARTLSAIFDEVQAETGSRPYIGVDQDLYRLLAKQVALLHQNYHVVASGGTVVYGGKQWAKNKGSQYVTCATPGYSNHGDAIAADISFPTSACRLAFRRICLLHDWTNAGDAFGEDWHKEYHGPITTTAGTGTPIAVEIPAAPIRRSNTMIVLLKASTAAKASTGGGTFCLYDPAAAEPASRWQEFSEYAIARALVDALHNAPTGTDGKPVSQASAVVLPDYAWDVWKSRAVGTV